MQYIPIAILVSILATFSFSPKVDYSEEVGGTSFMMKEIPGGVFMMGCGIEDEPLYLGSAARYRHDRTYRESGDGFRLAYDMN